MQPTSQRAQTQTHCLNVFSGPMISDAISQEKTETDSHPGCVFRSHDQSCNFWGNTETNWLPGYVFRSHDQSCNFSGNAETDSPPRCVFRSHDQSCVVWGNTETDWPPGYVWWGMQLLEKHINRLTSWMCFEVPRSVMQLLRKHKERLTLWMYF